MPIRTRSRTMPLTRIASCAPMLLLLVLACARSWSADASIQDRLKQHLIGCKNDQVCCELCETSACPTTTCVGDLPAPARNLGKCESVASSVAPNLRYRHTAYDHRVDPMDAKGCASCGSAPGVGGISPVPT